MCINCLCHVVETLNPVSNKLEFPPSIELYWTIQVSIPLSYCFSAHFVAIPLGFGAKIPTKRIVFRPPRGCWMLQRRLGQEFDKKRMMILFQKMASDGKKHVKTARRYQILEDHP